MLTILKQISLTKLNNELHSQFHTLIIMLFLRLNPTILGFFPLFKRYENANENEKEALDLIRKNDFTK